MKKLLDTLHRYRWLTYAVLALAIVTWVVVVGFGERLGVDEAVRRQVDHQAGKVWGFLTSVILAPMLRDKDGDGRIAAVDEDDNDPEK